MLREGQSRQRQGLKQGVPACFTAGYEGSSHGMCGARAAELGAIVTKRQAYRLATVELNRVAELAAIVTKGLSVGLRQGQGQRAAELAAIVTKGLSVGLRQGQGQRAADLGARDCRWATFHGL